MIDSILKAANKIKEEASELCDNVTKKLDSRKEIGNYKDLNGKEFEVAVPIYKASAGAVFADEENTTNIRPGQWTEYPITKWEQS